MNTRALAAQTQVRNVHRWVKPLGEIVTSVSIITAFASVIVGTIVIKIYLSNFAIPISPLDTFSASSVHIFVFFFIALLGSAFFIFLVPFYAAYLVPRETRDSLQELFDTLRPQRGTFYNFLKEYATFYLPTLSLIWSIPIIMQFEIPADKILPWVILSSFIVPALLLSIYRLKGRPKSESLLALLWVNWMTMLWILVIEIGVSKAWGYAVNDSIIPMWKAVLEVIGASLLVTLCHMAMARARLSINHLAGAAVMLLVFFLVYPGYAALGAAALRAAQLGGGTHISYTVVGPPATTPEPTSGCLVLATNRYVLIGELDGNSCPSLRRFWGITASEAKPRPVREFSRSEIKISEMLGGE